MLRTINKYKVHILIGVVALMPVDVICRIAMYGIMWSIYTTYFVWKEYRHSRELEMAFKDAQCRRKVLKANNVISKGL